MGTKFYVENKKDKWGNRSFPAAVIEAEIVEGERYLRIVFKAPARIVNDWPDAYYRPDEWTEVEGPAQLLGQWEDCDVYITEHAINGATQPDLPLLKNGASEARNLVEVAMFVLQALLTEDPVAFYELVMLCRDPKHELWGNTRDKLTERNLVESSGQPHSSMRNIVLSAVTGDDFDLTLGNPFQ